MLKIVIIGLALSSLWFWLYALIHKEWKSILIWWLKIIVPQGLIISFALAMSGII